MLDQKSLNGLRRPMSAAVSGQFTTSSFGKFIQQQNIMDERTVQSIWKGFGSYLAKELRNGRGIFVPRFGNFTFTSPNVDLAGTTNPNERDKQFREPVFLIGKDFVNAVTIRTGIAYNRGGQIRPFDNKGASGIIPKVKINFTEVAGLCAQNKDSCKNGCEQVFRFLADKAKRGELVTMDIPFIGQFIIKNNVAAISFNEEVMQDTKGVTAKNHYVNKLFASSDNKHNLRMLDQNQLKHNPSVGLGGNIKVTGDAESWLKSNLNINVNDLGLQSIEPTQRRRLHSAQGSRKPIYNTSTKNKSWGIAQQSIQADGMLTESNKQLFDHMSETKMKHSSGPKRPMSAYTRGSNNSRMTNLPEISRAQLTMIISDIYKNRQVITEHQQSEGANLRDNLTSSEIQGLFKRVGMNLEIGVIKAILKDLGFNWNGKACSMMSLFQKCHDFSKSDHQNSSQTIQHDTIVVKNSVHAEEFLNKIKDLFYSTGKQAIQIFSEAKTGSGIDVQGLKKIVQKYSSNGVPDEQIEQAFRVAAQGSPSLSFQEFERAFMWKKPTGTDWETRCIRAIRGWMYKNQLSSENAFELLLQMSNKISEKRLTRPDFHATLSVLELKLSAPEVDGLFKTLDINQDGELDLKEWQNKIYCDSENPLQMLREVIQTGNLSTDDILFRMNARIWDSPLDFPKFSENIRKLDPSLGDNQLRTLAKSLKNKDGKIEINTLLTNLVGKEFETVDYRNKVFRQIYTQIYPNKERKLLKLLEEADPQNDGKIEPSALKIALIKVTSDIDQETIDRFVRFLDKDTSGKVDYVGFMDKLGEVSNKDHNPFKSIVQRLAFFLKSNDQTVQSIIKRLTNKGGAYSDKGVSVEVFSSFLKNKIDKKRDQSELVKYGHYMDIDKDGFISEIDLQTCITNLGSDAFFRDGGAALASSAFSSQKKFFPQAEIFSAERAFEISKQIKAALISQKIAFKEAFNRFDTNKDGFISFNEFSVGLDAVMQLSLPVKEKFFAFMDKNQIGLVDYKCFLDIMQSAAANKMNAYDLHDSFDWENQVIEQIKAWIIRERITVEEAFKCFDKDFDGFINKEDLKYSLMSILKVKEEEILSTRLDRLFKLMDFYKSGQIQPSDFQRLMNDQNPYQTTGGRKTAASENFKKSFGGNLGHTSTFDWKLSAIQSIGLFISRKYSSVKESFDDASELLQKINFEQFKRYIEKHQILQGFNMTLPLTQKLFAELDPHKKGYLTESDWVNSFQCFKHSDQVMIELKNTIQCSFSDCASAFQFFLAFKNDADNKKQSISRVEFGKAVTSLSNSRFNKQDIDSLWKHMSENGKHIQIDKYVFRVHFDNIPYSGYSTVRELKSAPPGARTTIVSVSSSSSQWESDIIEKLRQIIKSSSLSFEDIFKKFDEDGNGSISQIEFRNSIRRLNLGLSSREIDKIMTKIDLNSDGKIDWKEFMSMFQTSDLDDRLKDRARDKMARLKELMIMHMTSPIDAFRFFDESKLGKLTYQEFSKLVIKAHEIAGDQCPAYPVIKDLFDAIDIRKDGIIDMNEWQQTFGIVSEGNNKLTIKSNSLAMWENTREYQRIGTLIAKNRRLLKDQFANVLGNNKSTVVTFDQAKIAMLGLLQPHFNAITEEKMKTILKVGEVQGASEGGLGNRYDYMRMLDVYKNRHAAPQL